MTFSSPSPGTLYGISAGPGDPELISLKGLRILQRVSYVAFPAGTNGRPGIAEQIVTPWLRPEQKCLPLAFPYVRDADILTPAWEAAATTLWQYLDRGEDVAFVTEGDASFYSTLTYLSRTLRQLYPSATVETIPGVTSPLAAAAALGLPLTSGSQRLAVLPALYHIEELEAAMDWADVVVLMKVGSVYDRVIPVLQRRQLLDRAYAVERATWPQQVVYRPLLPDLKLSYFSLLVVEIRGSIV
mgnify:CR=1 FL=1